MNFETFLWGLVICFLLSFVLGLERQFRRRFIGLRTMILVAIGSYIFVSFSFLVTGYQIDVTRISAQVVAGIGFLGAGVIIKDNERSKVRGLTTAATLWCDAGIGILCAGGFIKEAIVSSMMVLFANIVLRYVNSLINDKVEDRITSETFSISLKLSKKNVSGAMEYITNLISRLDYIDAVNYLVDEEGIKFDIIVSKINDSKIDKFINKITTELDISKYEYKKVGEVILEEENDEL